MFHIECNKNRLFILLITILEYVSGISNTYWIERKVLRYFIKSKSVVFKNVL